MNNPMQPCIAASELGRKDAQSMKVGDYYQPAIIHMKNHGFDTEDEETFYFGGFVSSAPNVIVNSFGTIVDIAQR